MPEIPERDAARYGCTQSRELSWLRFNRRVLEEAGDESVPLLERLKFISIFTSNLDEFFMVRVGNLFDLTRRSPEDIDDKTGETPAEQLERVYRVIPGLIAVKESLYTEVAALLRGEGVCDLTMEELTAEERKYVAAYYKTRVLPVLSPQIVDSHHPFPHLANKALYVAALLRLKKERSAGYTLGVVPVPASVPAYLPMPGNPGRFLRMETVVRHWVPGLFPGYRLESDCLLCVTRSAELGPEAEMLDDGGEDILTRMTELLKKRASQSVVRLELSEKPAGELLKILKARVGVSSRQIYVDRSPLNMRYVSDMIRALPPERAAALSFAPYRPRWPEDLEENVSLIDQLRRKDRLLFFPFDSVEPFLRLLSEAAERPDVASIRITIYRLATASKIAHILCKAAENGKEVTVLMELRARFDEQNNIAWSRLLEDAGCQVIYGVDAYKCHSKVCLITLRQGDRLRYITQIGTGNYNEQTNAMYTDLSLMTAREEIGLDAAAFFQNMLVGNLEGEYRHLLVAPAGLKQKLLELIDEQTAKGVEGYICVKANAMTEREIMDKLSEASRAGVQIHMILRGICCLRPGIAAQTENIHVTSIVGRFLEHARIYCFGRGEDAKLFIASADFMTRNLNRRVEVACPIYDRDVRQQLLWILRTQLEDNVKASSLLPDGSYSRKINTLAPSASQEIFMAQSSHKGYAARPQGLPRLLRDLRSRLRDTFS